MHPAVAAVAAFTRFAILAALCSAAACRAAGPAPELTATEQRWLQGLWPVLLFARDSRLPVDIVVQPQPTPEAPPLALAFIGGRCKVVLSMRGNPEAQATLDRIAPDLLDATLALMAAHELGHCRRYLDGAWYGLPAGFAAGVPETLAPEQHAAWREMQAVRREEGFADLVGLAWVRQHHPQHYARLHAWLLAERADTPVAGSHHDTRAWLRLAAPGAAVMPASSIFDAAAALWPAGLATPAD